MSSSTNRSLDRRDIRLPGSVAEVDASPHGPKVGAFFDLDGTLVAGFTGVIMTQDRMRRREIGVGEFLGVVQAALNHQLGRADFEQLIYRGASMMRGRSLEDIDELGERLFVQHVVSRIYPEMRELVRAHMARGHTVVLSSSALTVQVDPVARFLSEKQSSWAMAEGLLHVPVFVHQGDVDTAVNVDYSRWGVRLGTVTALVAGALALGYWDTVRFDGMWGNFKATIHWRWEKTAEQEFLAERNAQRSHHIHFTQ